jgi:hypothetical protein
MPSINNLDLTMSRDTNGVITARVDFELQFSQFEIDAKVSISERVALVRQIGDLDRWDLGAGGPVQSQGNQGDATVAVLSSGDVDAASLGLSAGAASSVTRSFTHVLSYAEREVLLEVGRDHPYAVVSVVPKGLSADLKLAAVEMLDVGDPETVTTVDVGGEPTALVADGQSFYVATAGGEVVVFDRSGDQQARFAVGGSLSALAYDGSSFWAAASDGDAIKPFDKTGTVGTPRQTGGTGPVAVVATGLSVWVANAGSQTVTQTSANGVVSTTPVPGRPTAFALYQSQPGVVFVAIANQEGGGVVQSIDATGTVAGTWGCVSAPRAVAIHDAVGVPIVVYTSGDVGHINSVNVLAGTFGGPSRGLAQGAGALWVALESDELAKFAWDAAGPSLVSSYPVGSGADAVLFDTDRVYVANRAGNSVCIVRI